MTYAALDDLIERAGESEILQVADRDEDGTVDPDVVDAALVDADNVINGYIGVKYQVPLTATPDLVRTWATSIARYLLHRYDRPDYVSQDYKDAISALKDVQAGRSALIGAEGIAPAASSGAGSVLAAHPAPFFNSVGWLR